MLQRIFVTLIFALLPLQALADTSTGDATPGVTQPQSQDAGLGPSSSASTSDGTSLQPAGTSPLQSTSNDSNGLTAPNSSYLQEPANAESSGNLQVLLGNNADGSQQPLPGTGPNYWAWLFFCLLFAFCAAAVVWFMRTRNNRNRMSPAMHYASDIPDTLEAPADTDATTHTDRAAAPDIADSSLPDDLPDVGDTDRDPTPDPGPQIISTPDTETAKTNEQVPIEPEVSKSVDASEKESAVSPETPHSAKARKSKRPRRPRR